MNLPQSGRKLETTETSLRVAESLKELNGGRVTQVADHLDISKSVVHSHLSTLLQCGYVVKEGDEYHLGLRFTNLGDFAKNRKDAYRRVREMTTEWAEDIHLNSDFIVEENGRGVYLKTEVGTTDPNLLMQVGDPAYLHSTAAGKAILAAYPREWVKQIIGHWGLPAETESTITDEKELFEELAQVRDQGYSTNLGENKSGVRAVGASVSAPDGTLLGAVTVNGPEYLIKEDYFKNELPDKVMSFATRIESEI